MFTIVVLIVQKKKLKLKWNKHFTVGKERWWDLRLKSKTPTLHLFLILWGLYIYKCLISHELGIHILWMHLTSDGNESISCWRRQDGHPIILGSYFKVFYIKLAHFQYTNHVKIITISNFSMFFLTHFTFSSCPFFFPHIIFYLLKCLHHWVKITSFFFIFSPNLISNDKWRKGVAFNFSFLSSIIVLA